MRRRLTTWSVGVLALALSWSWIPTAGAEIEPPWCGTPEPDAAEALPDGTDPGDPVGSFPHIPYYAIECTLEDIAAQSGGRMSIEVAGQSATGRDLYLVTINEIDTAYQKKAFSNWGKLRRDALTDPAKAQRFLEKFDGQVKVPLYIQGGIHGNEYEGVDANMRVIEKLATTPYGADPLIDDILDHAVVLFNVIQNPDGRVAGTRANGNGFDLNRDFLTQSQSETRASVSIMQEWIPPEMLDLHGYATPTLIEATTKPHNPSIEYDMWLKWNQARLDANEAALNAAGYDVQRPINDWCEDADLPPPSGICPGGTPPGPAVAEGWDDWGPFYTPMYSQHVGLNGSTTEMCRSESQCGGRAGALEIQEVTVWSTLEYDVANRHDLLFDELEIYRRGVTDAARPACCPPPFDVDNNWMNEYPDAYMIPLGQGQRSDPEANRLVEWLLFNGVEVERLRKDASFDGATLEAGSYFVPMDQARRGLADTALSIGVDVSDRINTLYAPPGAWSHGYLWGADVVTIPEGSGFAPHTKPAEQPGALGGGIEAGTATHYALEIDSATAVRTLNELVGDGVSAEFALESFTSASGAALPAGSAVFPASSASALDAAGQANGLLFHRLEGVLPAVDPVEGVPRIAVLTGAVNQDIWVLRELGFTADPISTASSGALNDPSAPNPLDDYDVVFNTGSWPSGATARARLTAFFDEGGGYIGAGRFAATFLNAANSGQLDGFVPEASTGGGQSGIFNWTNAGGADSPIVGSFPEADTLIMDPPTWFASVPATATVDGLLAGDPSVSFASGLWRLPRPASADDAVVAVHGESTDGVGEVARITAFAFNPLYRADPEREWPMVGTAAYWSDQ
ncbi:MAG: M14 family zinc carboxypeptidase [Actinomycetota bacterium]